MLSDSYSLYFRSLWCHSTCHALILSEESCGMALASRVWRSFVYPFILQSLVIPLGLCVISSGGKRLFLHFVGSQNRWLYTMDPRIVDLVCGDSDYGSTTKVLIHEYLCRVGIRACTGYRRAQSSGLIPGHYQSNFFSFKYGNYDTISRYHRWQCLTWIYWVGCHLLNPRWGFPRGSLTWEKKVFQKKK